MLIPSFSIRKDLLQFIQIKILNNLVSFVNTLFLDKTFYVTFIILIDIEYIFYDKSSNNRLTLQISVNTSRRKRNSRRIIYTC